MASDLEVLIQTRLQTAPGQAGGPGSKDQSPGYYNIIYLLFYVITLRVFGKCACCEFEGGIEFQKS